MRKFLDFFQNLYTKQKILLGFLIGSVILTCLFFFSMVFTDQVPFYFDVLFYIYPNMKFWSHSLLSGEIPFWNPYLKGGIPFLADPPVGFYYPFHIFFLLFEFPQAIKIFYIFHYALAFLGCYYCARQYKISPMGAFLAGITFAFSGYLISMASLFTKLRGLAWIPLFFGLSKKSRSEKNPNLLILSALVLALVILGGHFYVAYFALVFLSFEILVDFFSKKKSLKSNLLALAIILGISVGFSAIQWLPSVTVMKETERTMATLKIGQGKWHLQPKRLLEFTVPSIHGAHIIQLEKRFSLERNWSSSIYFGLFPLLLGLFALFKIKRDQKIFWGGMLLFATILALGKYTFLYGLLLKTVPLLSRLRYMEKFVFWMTFPIAILAGMGYDHLFSKKKINRMAVLLFTLGTALGILLFPLPTSEHFFVQPLFRASLLFLICIMAVICRKKYIWAGVFLIGITLGDMQRINSREIFLTSPRIYSSIPDSIKALPKTSLGHFRIMRYPYDEPMGDNISFDSKNYMASFLESLKEKNSANIATAYGYEIVSGLTPITFWRWHSLLTIRTNLPKIYDLFGVKKILSTNSPPFWLRENYEKEKSFPLKFAWYNRKSPFSRTKLYYNIQTVSNPMDAQSFVRIKNLSKWLIVEKLGTMGSEEFKRGKNDFSRILSYGLNEVTVEVQNSSKCYLAFFDSYSQGWTVQNNMGKKLPIYYGDLLFRAIPLDGGHHKLIFRYTPPAWRLSWMIFWLTFMGLFSYFMGIFYRSYGKKG